MKQLSERVESEFERWQEQYDIELGEEFQVKTLLQLQEEYDDIKPDSSNTRTRETLLSMIKSLHSNLRLKKRLESTKSQVINIVANLSNKDEISKLIDELDKKLKNMKINLSL